MKHKSLVTLGLAACSLVALGGLASAQEKVDFPFEGPAVPPVPAASENYSISYTGKVPAPVRGALDADDSTYNRVLTNCAGLSGVGTAVFYDTIRIVNNSSSTATFITETSDQGAPGSCASIDTFLTAYQPTFAPASPLTNCVAADDDSGPNACSRMTLSVPASGTAVIVVTSFSNGATFPYQVNFTDLDLIFKDGFQGLGAGPHIIAVDSSRPLYEIDIATGAKTQFGTVSVNASTSAELTVGAGNTVYLSSTGNDSLYTLDLATGTATLVGAYGDSAIVMHGLEYVPTTAKLYGVSSPNNGLYDIDTTTGVATLIGTSGLSSFTNLGWNSATGVMYATNSGTDSLYTMDLATGAASLVGPLSGPTNPNGLAFDPDDGKLYLVDNSTDSFYSINMSTGAATLIGSTGTGNLLGLAYINE